jgi:short-subunit dehydrogenase
MKLENKVVLITGASRGIGLEAARVFSERGARVVMAARSRAELERHAAELPRARAVELDVTADVEPAVRAAVACFGRVDVLINNAGNGGRLGLLLEQPAEHTEQMFAVHVLGTVRMTRALLPIFLEQGAGRIVNVASTVGYVPMPGAAAYCAAKAAVIGFSRALRGELAGKPVQVALFSPPHTQTEAGKAWPLDLPRQFSPRYAAEAMVTAIERDRLEVLAGHAPLLALQRLWPAQAEAILRNMGLKALAKSATPSPQ